MRDASSKYKSYCMRPGQIPFKLDRLLRIVCNPTSRILLIHHARILSSTSPISTWSSNAQVLVGARTTTTRLVRKGV
eukprot:scaffold213616_cov39-Tisochrysis_lutea.AAC.2